MAHLIMYKSNGLSLSAPYIQIVHIKSEKVWDFQNEEYTDSPSSYSDTTLALDPKGDSSGDPSALHGGWPITIPTGCLDVNGVVDVVVKDNATPANTDLVKTGKQLTISGKQMISPTKTPFVDF